jgi:hypothetical protein
MELLQNGSTLGGECTVLHFSNTNCLWVPEKSHGLAGYLSIVKLDMMYHEWFTVVPDRLPLRIQQKIAGSTTTEGETLNGFSHFTTFQ